MKNWNERLVDARKESGLTKTELARAVGVSNPTVTDWESGKIKTIKGQNLQRVCELLNVQERWLLTGRGNRSKSQGNSYKKSGRVPVVSWIKAGEWADSPDNYAPGDAEEWLDCPFPHSAGSIYLRVIGDSMSPEYREGEYILVDPDISAVHGDDVVVRNPDGGCTFKRLQITPDGTYLLALNPDHPGRKMSIPAATRIVGVVTASLQKRR